MPQRRELSARERIFVREYLVDLNATQAAIRAGYSRRSASRNTHKVFYRPRVKAAIAAALAERAAKLEITAERVLRELALLGFANLRDYVTPEADGTARLDLSALSRDQAAAIRELTVEEVTTGQGAAARTARKVKVRLADKKGSLELVGKHLGLFGRKAGDGQEGETQAHAELSDLERAQEILRLLAAARAPEDGCEPEGEPGDLAAADRP
jgi:phage terminase small subunit